MNIAPLPCDLDFTMPQPTFDCLETFSRHDRLCYICTTQTIHNRSANSTRYLHMELARRCVQACYASKGSNSDLAIVCNSKTEPNFAFNHEQVDRSGTAFNPPLPQACCASFDLKQCRAPWLPSFPSFSLIPFAR